LKTAGIVGIVFDKDNTLTKPYQDNIHSSVKDALEECKLVFGKKAVIFSNTVGGSQDRNFERAKSVERSSGLSVIRHNEQKPGGMSSLMEYFQCPATQLVFVGDRYLTDVLFGNMNGMLTIKTEIFTAEGENLIVRNVG